MNQKDFADWITSQPVLFSHDCCGDKLGLLDHVPGRGYLAMILGNWEISEDDAESASQTWRMREPLPTYFLQVDRPYAEGIFKLGQMEFGDKFEGSMDQIRHLVISSLPEVTDPPKKLGGETVGI